MRHRKRGRKLGRKTDPRRALRRDVVNALFRHGRITTTITKAKEFRPYAERMITVAKKGVAAREAGDDAGALTAYRRLISELHDESVAGLLMDSIAPTYTARSGGYTRILRHARGRLGDNATTAIFELVDYDASAVESGSEAAEA